MDGWRGSETSRDGCWCMGVCAGGIEVHSNSWASATETCCFSRSWQSLREQRTTDGRTKISIGKTRLTGAVSQPRNPLCKRRAQIFNPVRRFVLYLQQKRPEVGGGKIRRGIRACHCSFCNGLAPTEILLLFFFHGGLKLGMNANADGGVGNMLLQKSLWEHVLEVLVVGTVGVWLGFLLGVLIRAIREWWARWGGELVCSMWTEYRLHL